MTKPISNRQEGHDMVNHPPHYADTVPGVECIEVTRNFDFNCGNVIKYVWRAGSKAEDGFALIQKEHEDIKKARFYLRDEIKNLEAGNLIPNDLSRDAQILIDKVVAHFYSIEKYGRGNIIKEIARAFSDPTASHSERVKHLNYALITLSDLCAILKHLAEEAQ
jgi:hypothetical protein